jgi:hypothetical protein
MYMANQADVNVKNVFNDNVTINVKRVLQGGTCDLEVNIAKGEAQEINLPSPEVKLEVTVPGEVEFRNCLLKIKTDVDLETIYSRTEGKWTTRIIPNDLPPDTPTTVNYTVGQDEPD